jgi:hypothetical protein
MLPNKHHKTSQAYDKAFILLTQSSEDHMEYLGLQWSLGLYHTSHSLWTSDYWKYALLLAKVPKEHLKGIRVSYCYHSKEPISKSERNVHHLL